MSEQVPISVGQVWGHHTLGAFKVIGYGTRAHRGARDLRPDTQPTVTVQQGDDGYPHTAHEDYFRANFTLLVKTHDR